MKTVLMVYLFTSVVSANELINTLQRETAAEIANTLNNEISVLSLLANSKLDNSIKNTVRAEIGPMNVKEKLVFTARDNQVEVAINGKVRLTVKLVNPILESYLVNTYPTSLLGKTDLERYNYLKTVIRASLVKPNSAAQYKLLILIPQAVAAEKSSWLTDAEVSKLALATTEITNTAKIENCAKIKENAKFKSSYTGALQNRYFGIVENFTFGELAAQVGVTFWCGNLKTQLAKPVTSFHIKCEAGKAESMSYGSNENSGANVGYINRTEKTFGDITTLSIIETRFGKDFATGVSKCCGSTACASQVNTIAPLSVADSPNTHEKIKTKMAK